MVDFNKKLRDLKLRKSMDAQVGKTGSPSLVPSGVEPERVSEAIPDMQEVIEDAGVRQSLIRLVGEDVAWAQQESEAKRMRKPIKDTIKKLLGRGEKRFICDSNRVVYYSSIRSSVDPKKLLSLGVSPQTIAAATITATNWTLKITPPKQDDAEEDSDE